LTIRDPHSSERGTMTGRLDVTVKDIDDAPIRRTKVVAVPEALGPTRRGKYDRRRKLYFFDDLAVGFYNVLVERSPYVKQERRLQVHPKRNRIGFILYTRKQPFTFRGDMQVPYIRQPDRIGVIISREDIADKDKKIKRLFARLDLEVDDYASPGVMSVDSNKFLTARLMMLRPRAGGNNLELRHSGSAVQARPYFDYGLILKILRTSHLFEVVGPAFKFRDARDTIYVFTNELVVRFLPEVTRKERLRLLRSVGLRWVRETSCGANSIIATAPVKTGEEINQMAISLLKTGRLMYAEPSLAEVPALDYVKPKDFLWPGCWDRRLVRADYAWTTLGDRLAPVNEFGSPEVVIAVVDHGIKSINRKPENPDFVGRVSNGKRKVYKLFDFTKMRADNDCLLEGDDDGDEFHGVACASLAAALANNSSKNPHLTNVGVVGTAPNCRLMGLIPVRYESDRVEMFVWAAGLTGHSTDSRFPRKLPRGADVFTCSLGLGADAPLSGLAKDMFDLITTRGRMGRGCLAIFSAGNLGVDIENYRPYGSYERSMSCAASILGSHAHEAHAPYSGWGRVEWCAPSSTSFQNRKYDPPAHLATWAAEGANLGNLPSAAKYVKELVREANPCDPDILISSTTGLEAGKGLFIGRPEDPGSEIVQIESFGSDKGQVTLRVPLKKKHRVGKPVIGGPNHHRSDFGGTSSATPLSAGICALVLSANPNLTWVEARQILRDTARKIDRNTRNRTGQWLDVKGVPSWRSRRPPVFSQWFGHGRLDAQRAVQSALDYAFERDLMIRTTLHDSGTGRVPLSNNSPDIWVRNHDPAIDANALPKAYDRPGPHEEPLRSNNRWIYARIKNRGSKASLDAWVRFYVALSNSGHFVYPRDWDPQNGLGNVSDRKWRTGTYFIGEVALPSIGPKKSLIVNIPWAREFAPPPTRAKKYVLVEITPQDGPIDRSDGRRLNNNLAVKSIVIRG
jgi:subtilisin family serine protease